MKKGIILLFSVSLFFLFHPGFSEDIDPSGRWYLVHADAKGRIDNGSMRLFDSGKTLEISFNIPKGADIRDTVYALHIKGYNGKEAPPVFLNSKRVNFSPLRRKDGLLLRLPPGRLKKENILEIVSVEGASLSFETIEIFSLLDTFEEVHFEKAFSNVKILDQPPKHPNQDKYDALHYDLSFDMNMTSTLLSNAALSVTGRVTAETLDQVVLDFHPNSGNMNISQVQAENLSSLVFSIDAANNWLLVTLPETLGTSDTFTFTVHYSGYPATTGVFGAPYRAETHGSGDPVVFTFSQPYGARHWWPCKDIPEDKATMDLHVTVDKPYYLVSNGKLMSIEDLGAKRRFHYSETFPIVTYLVSLCCSNYMYVSGEYTAEDGITKMPVGHYVYPENYELEKNGLIGTLEAMNLFVDLFGEYPFLTEKYVTATHNSGAGMEHQTCTSMPEENLYPDGRHRRNVHELCHQWFGDSITMEHYDHLWLNEGFATYSEALYNERYKGKTAYHDYVNGWVSSGINNNTPIVNPDADQFWGSLVYRKGAWVLHMLRHVMGDEDFFQAIRNYYNKYAYTTALTPDLQAEFEALYGKSLDFFFQEWVYGMGRPTYGRNWSMETYETTGSLHLTIDQTQSGQVFTMPVDVKVSDINGNSQTFVVWNNQKNQSFDIDLGEFEAFDVEIDPDNWILNYFEESSVTMPTLLSVKPNVTKNVAVIEWEASSGSVKGYQLIMSENLTSWTLSADSGDLTSDKETFTIEGLEQGKDYYFRIRALSTTGTPSSMSDVYGLRLTGDADKVLIVEGYDRWDDQDRGISHPWAAWHGKSVDAFGIGFDSCANESVKDGSFLLSDYDAVIWVLGEESTRDDTFDSSEQSLVSTYLQGGGKLFVTGAEIGWDLDYKYNGRSFYNNYLKADYVQDDSDEIYNLSGTTDGIFKGLSFSFDDGSAGIYYAIYPDVISPMGGSLINLKYGGTLGAGIQFSGTFPSGQSEGKLVYLGFPFETIYPASARDEVMARVLRFFGFESTLPVQGYCLY